MQRGAAAPRSLARPVTVAGRLLRAPGTGEGTASRPALRQPGRSRLLPAQPRGAARGQGSCPHPKTRFLGLVCSQPPVPALGRALPTATSSRRPGSPSAGAPGAGCGDLGPGHPRCWWGPCRAGAAGADARGGLRARLRGPSRAPCAVPSRCPARTLPGTLLGSRHRVGPGPHRGPHARLALARPPAAAFLGLFLHTYPRI